MLAIFIGSSILVYSGVTAYILKSIAPKAKII